MKRCILFTLSLALLHLSATLDASDEVSATQVSKDFTSSAKKAIPAVVSIKTQFKPKQSRIDDGDPRRDLFEFFHDDFFQKFFGSPKEGQRFGFSQPEPQPTFGQGSGFIVSDDGYIITNNHVVDNGDEIIVKLNDGREYEATIVGQDPQSDLSLIKIEGKNLPFLHFADSSLLEPGQWAIAVGNPLGLQASLTVGVVSATGRANLNVANFEDFIQTDAAINRGNSGGPLLNVNGEVIGVNTAIASSTGGYMGIGFAIPSNMVKTIMDQLLDKGEVVRGFIGVTLQPIDSDLSQAFNLDNIEGALITDITDESPAKEAGLMRGDIILEYNGKRVQSISQFRNSVAMIAPGTEVVLLIKRDKEMIKVPVKIGLYPNSQSVAPEVKEEATEIMTKIGISVENLTPELAKSLDVVGEKGVVVNKVDPKSQAAIAGVKKGALILSVNQEKVSNVAEFNSSLAKQSDDRGILLLIKQDKAIRYLFIKNPKLSGNESTSR